MWLKSAFGAANDRRCKILKCRKCEKEAVVKLRHYNLALCQEHFFEFFEGRVEKAIKKFKMFARGSKILVAVSGGKDSVTLWYVLVKLGYNADGLFIKLGREEEVRPAYDKVRKLSEDLGRKLLVLDATEYLYGFSTFEAARILRRPTCSYCGMVKRYLMNLAAYENGYDVLATGHNLDDEASVLLGNILHWQADYIMRSYPVLEKTHEKLVKKVKPLVLNYEDDIKLYAKLRGLDFLESACPFAIGATSKLYKRLLNELEREQAGVKLSFYLNFLREKKEIFRVKESRDALKLNSCKICGYPTTGEICTFCRSRELLEKRIKDRL